MIVKEDGPARVFSSLRDFFVQSDAIPEWVAEGSQCVSCASVWAAALLWFVPSPIRSILAGSAIAKLVEDYFYAGVEGEDLVEIAPGEFMERSQVPRAFYEQGEE